MLRVFSLLRRLCLKNPARAKLDSRMTDVQHVLVDFPSGPSDQQRLSLALDPLDLTACWRQIFAWSSTCSVRSGAQLSLQGVDEVYEDCCQSAYSCTHKHRHTESL